jgi:hypothetical protein
LQETNFIFKHSNIESALVQLIPKKKDS